MARAIFNNIIPNSSKTRIAINYGEIVKNNTWSSIPTSNIFIIPDDIGEKTRIEGTYLVSYTNATALVNQIIEGSDIYFKAYYFNKNLNPIIMSSSISYDSRNMYKYENKYFVIHNIYL